MRNDRPIPPGLVRWGKRGLLVKLEAVVQLEKDCEDAPEIRALLWRDFVQGYGFAAASGSTHADGWCMDFDTSRWTREQARRVARVLNRWWATAFRYRGELGPRNPAHLHAAFHNRANYSAIVRKHKIAGHTIEDQIRRAIPA